MKAEPKNFRLMKRWTSAFLMGCLGIASFAWANNSFEQKHVGADGLIYHKYIDSKGVVRGVVYDASGREVSPVFNQADVVGEKLAAKLKRSTEDEVIVVRLALHEQDEDEELPTQQIEVVSEDGKLTLKVNGQRKSLQEEEALSASRISAIKARNEMRRQARLDNALAVVKAHGLKVEPQAVERYADTGESMLVSMKKNELEAFIKANRELIAAIDLPEVITHDIESAKFATAVTPAVTSLFQSNPGNGIGIYLTDDGCPNPSATATNPWGSNFYMRLSGSPAAHGANTTGIVRSVSPFMFLYCRASFYSLPTASERPGISGKPPIYIMTQSGSDKSNNQYMILDRDYDNYIYDHRILHINSAGNNTPYVGSPGKALNVLTVGSFRHQTVPYAVSTFSNYGNPGIGNQKPELVAPGENITAGGYTMSGTSMSTPHVAGIAANFMGFPTFSPLLRYRPALAKAHLMASAVIPITGGYNKVGWGGARYYSGMRYFHVFVYEGSNSYLNSPVRGTFTLNAMPLNKVRVVLTWLNRGTFLYNNGTIGMDLDLRVYGPNGNLIGSSLSANNPFEVVEFMPTQSGTYSFEITRFSNRDTASRVEAAVWVYKDVP